MLPTHNSGLGPHRRRRYYPTTSGVLMDLRKADLVRLAEERGLATSGTKDELVGRLEEHDKNGDPDPHPIPGEDNPEPVNDELLAEGRANEISEEE